MAPARQLALKGMKLAFVGAAMSLFASAPALPAQRPTEVDLKLVLAVDVSGSISNREHRLQREGTAAAFADPEVVKAIQSGPLGRIAVAMLDFSSPELGRIVIDWHIIQDAESAAAFAETVRETPRSPGRRTSVSSALELGAFLLETSEGEIIANRRVIDVSGDGPNNDGNSMTEVHDRVIAQGIIVNGLPVMDESSNGYYPNLDRYYQACVIGGRGAFLVVARSFADFAAAMRRKLILEISQDEAQIRQAREESTSALLQFVGAAPGGRATAPQVMRPAENEFTGNCDIRGGFGFGGFR